MVVRAIVLPNRLKTSRAIVTDPCPASFMSMIALRIRQGVRGVDGLISHGQLARSRWMALAVAKKLIPSTLSRFET